MIININNNCGGCFILAKKIEGKQILPFYEIGETLSQTEGIFEVIVFQNIGLGGLVWKQHRNDELEIWNENEDRWNVPYYLLCIYSEGQTINYPHGVKFKNHIQLLRPADRNDA